MKRKFLLLTLMCILMGGVNSLFAQEPVTIDGTVGEYVSAGSSNYVPFNTKYEYTTSQQIYLKEELGEIKSGDQITKVAFHVKNVNGSCTRTIKIYMANITEDRFSTTTFYPFLMSTEDLVLSETSITIDAKNKWYTLELTKAFNYTGNNILFCVQDVTGSKYASNVTFDAYRPNERENNTLVLRQLYKYANAKYDPTSTTTAATTFSHPNVTSATGYNSLNWVQFTYSSGGTTPVLPTKVTNLSPTNNSIYGTSPQQQLEWTFGDNTTSYKVLVGKGMQDDAIVDIVHETEFLTKDKDSNNGSYTAEGLEPITTYYWQVVSKNENGETYGDIWSFTTIATQDEEPAMVTKISPANGTSLKTKDVVLKWKYNDDNHTSYIVYLGESENEMTELNSDIYSITEYIPNNLQGEKTYYWRVDVKNSSYTTKDTEIWSFTTQSVGSIKGIVKNDDIYVVGATVSIKDLEGNVIASTTTDTYGNFKFTDVVIGNYNLVIEKENIEEAV